MSCPNCNKSFEPDEYGQTLVNKSHQESGCLLGAALGALVERENDSPPTDEKVAKLDIDWFWERASRLIDNLEGQVNASA